MMMLSRALANETLLGPTFPSTVSSAGRQISKDQSATSTHHGPCVTMAAEASERWQQLQRSVVAQFVGEGSVPIPDRLAPLKAAVDATQEHLHKLRGELQQFAEYEARLDRLDVKTRELQPVPETTTRNAKQRLQKQQVGLTADLLRSAGALEPSLLVDATSEIRNAFAADASAHKSARSFDELMAAADALAAADRHAWLREWPDRIYYAWGRLCMRVVLLALFLCPCLLRFAQLPPRLLAAARWRLAADDVPIAAKQGGDGDPAAATRPVWAPPSSEAGAGPSDAAAVRGAGGSALPAAGGAKDKAAAPAAAGLRQRRPLPSNAGLSGSLGRRAAAEVSQAMAAGGMATGAAASAASAPTNEPAVAAGASLMAGLRGENAGATAKVATALTALRDRFAGPTAGAAADVATASAAGGQGAARGAGAAGARGKGSAGGGATSGAALAGASGAVAATSTRGAPAGGGQTAAGKPP